MSMHVTPPNQGGAPKLRPSKHHGTPQPLKASSWIISRARTEAAILGPKINGARAELAMGRFETTTDARKWADRVHPDAEMVVLTRFTAATGWVPQAIGQRRNGEWSGAER